MAHRALRAPRGLTLIELIVALGAAGILITLCVQAMVTIYRTQKPREVTAALQGEGRQGLAALDDDLRTASLGASVGNVWATLDGFSRPAVQILKSVKGGGVVAMKPQTDAVLVVRAAGTGPRTALVGNQTTASMAGTMPVTDSTGFSIGDTVLIGDFRDAAWFTVTGVGAKKLNYANLNHYAGDRANKFPAGSLVWRAVSHLYYVTPNDELVRAQLSVPYPPDVGNEVTDVVVLARGVENLSVAASTDNGLTMDTYDQRLGAGDPPYASASTAAGGFNAGGGPVLKGGDMPGIRLLTVTMAVRSIQPIVDPNLADPKIALNGVTVPVGGQPDGGSYVRRAYRITAGVRNTSFGSF